jgi:pSer/pThr/pTyr-binding forkhead associated (FHA) protein
MPGNARPLEAYVETARELDAEAFGARFGNSFLIVTATSMEGSGSTSTRLLLEGVDEDPGARTADLTVVVYALRCQGAGGHLVTIGRDQRHDVVIPDPSVSRFHAYAKRNTDGTCVLQDMQSSNGTTVNGQSVPARGAGPPTPVKPGDTVRFGRVQFTFTDARALREFALQAGR